jgi:hypothetical protein
VFDQQLSADKKVNGSVIDYTYLRVTIDSNRKLHDSSRTVHDACRHESFCKSRDPGGRRLHVTVEGGYMPISGMNPPGLKLASCY